MGWARWRPTARGFGALVASAAFALAQHASAAPPPTKTDAKTDQGPARSAPVTHAPLPTLPPAIAFHHVQNGNAALAAARLAGKPPPPPAERPAGAGRYVCAALVCADADLDVPSLLGLRSGDVLVLSVPGPFATPETTALLERMVVDERLSLVLVLAHADCRSLAHGTGIPHPMPSIAPAPGGAVAGARGATEPPAAVAHDIPAPGRPNAPCDVLARRVDALRGEAQRRRQSLLATLCQTQCTSVLAATEVLTAKSTRDELRVLPGIVDTKTRTITWLHQRADVMPIAPVK